jgi:hypothetical protein
MKPTSLSPEFYKNLYNLIINFGFVPEDSDDYKCTMEFDNVNGCCVTLEAVYDVREYRDGVITADFEDVYSINLTDEDGNDVTDLFDDETFNKVMKA